MSEWISQRHTAIIGFAGAVVVALNAFGVPITESQTTAILGLLSALLLLLGRTVKVASLERLDDAHTVTPSGAG